MGNQQQPQQQKQQRVELRKQRSFNPYSERKLRSSSVMMQSNAYESGRQSAISPQFTLNPNQNRQSSYINQLPSYATFADQSKLVISQQITPMNRQTYQNNQNSTSPNNQMRQDNLNGRTPVNFQRANDKKKSIPIYNQNMNLPQQLHPNSQINQSINNGANNLILNKYYNGQDLKNRSKVILNKNFNGELIDQNVLSNISQTHLNKTQQKIDTTQMNNTTIKDHQNNKYIQKVPMSERLLNRRNSDNQNATFQQQIEAFTRRSIRARRKKELKYQHQDDFIEAIEFTANYSLCNNLFNHAVQSLIQPCLLTFNQDIVQPFKISEKNESQKKQDKMQNEMELQKYLKFLNEIESSAIAHIDFDQITKEKKEDEELNLLFQQQEQPKIEKHQKHKDSKKNISIQKQLQLKNQNQSQNQKILNSQKSKKKDYPNKEFTNMVEDQLKEDSKDQQKQNQESFSQDNSKKQKNLRFISSQQKNEIKEENKVQKSSTPHANQKNKAKFDIKEEQRKLFSQQQNNPKENPNKEKNKTKQNELNQIAKPNKIQNDENNQDFEENATITEEEWDNLGNPTSDNKRDQKAKSKNRNYDQNEQSKGYQKYNNNEIDDSKDYDNKNGISNYHHQNESKTFNSKNNSFAKNAIHNKNLFSNMSSIIMNNSEQDINQFQHDEHKNQKKKANKNSKLSQNQQNSQQSNQQNFDQNNIIKPQKVQNNTFTNSSDEEQDYKNNNYSNQGYQSKNSKQTQQQKQIQTAHFIPEPNLGKGGIAQDKKYNQLQHNVSYNSERSNKQSNKVEMYNLNVYPQKQNVSEVNESFYVDVHKLEDQENMKRSAYKKAEEEYDEEIRRKEIENMLLEKQTVKTKESKYQAYLQRQQRIKELASKYYEELKNQQAIQDRSHQYQNSQLQKYENDESFYKGGTSYYNNRSYQTNHSYGQNNTSHYTSGQISSPNPNPKQKKHDSNQGKLKREQYQKQNSLERNGETIYNSLFYKDNEQSIVNLIMTNNAYRREDFDERQKYLSGREQQELQLKVQQQEQNSKQKKKNQDGIFDLDDFEEIDDEQDNNQSNDNSNQNSSEDENENSDDQEDSIDEQNKINLNQGRNQLSVITDITYKSDSLSPTKHDHEKNKNKQKQKKKKEDSSIDSDESKTNSESEVGFLKSISEQVERLKSKIEKDKKDLDKGNNEIQSKLASKMQINLSNSNLPHSDDQSNNSHIFLNSSNKILTNIFSHKYIPTKSENIIQIQSESNISSSQSQQNSSIQLNQNEKKNQQKDKQKSNSKQQSQIKQDQHQQKVQKPVPQDQKQKISNQPYEIQINPKSVSPSPSTGKSQNKIQNKHFNMEGSNTSYQSEVSKYSNNQQKSKLPSNQASKIKNEQPQINEITILSSPGQKSKIQPPFEFHQAISEYGFESNSQQSSFPGNMEEKPYNPQINRVQLLDPHSHAPSPSDNKIGYDALKAKRQGRLNTIKSQVEPIEESFMHQTHTQSKFGGEQQLYDRKYSVNSQISQKSNQTNNNKIKGEKNHNNNYVISNQSSANNIGDHKKQNAKSQFSNSYNQFEINQTPKSLKNLNNSETSSVKQSKISEQSNNSFNKLFKNNKNHDDSYFENPVVQFSQPINEEYNNPKKPSSKNISHQSSKSSNDNDEFQFGTPKSNQPRSKEQIQGKSLSEYEKANNKNSNRSSFFAQNNSKKNSIQNQWNQQSESNSHRSSNVEDYKGYKNSQPKIQSGYSSHKSSSPSMSKKESNSNNQNDIQSSQSSKQGYDMFEFDNVDKNKNKSKQQLSAEHLSDESEYFNKKKQNKNNYKNNYKNDNESNNEDDPNDIINGYNDQKGEVFDIDAFGFSNEDED